MPISCERLFTFVTSARLSLIVMFFDFDKLHEKNVKETLKTVYDALEEKGYNPINQLVGYLLSGDPAYVTSHNDARSMIRKLERDELLEELVRSYLEKQK